VKLFELAYCCRLFDERSGGDAALVELEASTKGTVNLSKLSHRDALVTWLRRWGCRTLATRDTKLTLSALERWWRAWRKRLPPAAAVLMDMDGSAAEDAAAAYGSLAELVVSYRRASRKKVPVRMGPTASAKALFAVRPHFFPPWDDMIRRELRLDGSAASYATYLAFVSRELQDLVQNAKGLGFQPAEIPALVGRSGQSFPKLIDEYLWVKSFGHKPWNASEVARLYLWSRN
jgi:hypothetical protein